MIINHLEKEEGMHMLRATEMHNIGNLHIVLLESARAIEAALSKLLLNSGMHIRNKIPSEMAYDVVRAGIISRDLFEMINELLKTRNKSIHNTTERLTEGAAKELLDITRRVLAELEKANQISTLQQALKLCPVVDGHLYTNLVAKVLATALGEIIDFDTIQMESCLRSAIHIDIELPLSKMISEYPLWKQWYDQYKIKSIIVEVKSTRKATGQEGVIQLRSYLEAAQKGNFGILVSRSGLTSVAILQLRKLAIEHNILILPLDQNDLNQLLKLSIQGQVKVLKYLRRKVSSLLRCD